MPPAFLDLIFPQHPLTNGHSSLPPRRCDNTTHTTKPKTHKKHRKRHKKTQQIRRSTGQTTQNTTGSTRTSIQPPKWQHDVTHTKHNTRLTAPPLGLSQLTYQHKCEKQKGAAKRGQNKNHQKPQNTVLDNTQTKTKNRHKNKQSKEPANLPKKDTKRDTSLRDLFRQLKPWFKTILKHSLTSIKMASKSTNPSHDAQRIQKSIHWNVKNVIISD
jgi:hypothetical protein